MTSALSRRLGMAGALATTALASACAPGADRVLSPKPTSSRPSLSTTGSAPQLVIVEVMADPSKVADAAGEYVKLYNPGPVAVDLQNYRILSGSGNNVYTGTGTVESHTITASVPIPVGGCVVLGNNTSSDANGGVTEAYSYGAQITLGNNTTDWVEIKTAGGALLDSVAYSPSTVSGTTRTVGTPTYTPGTGIARLVGDPSQDNTIVAGNTNWANATTSQTYGLGDRGTPNSCAYTWRSDGGTQTVGPLDHVALSAPATTVAAGGTLQLSATPQDASNATVATATVTWSTSNASVATVDNTGKVSGVAADPSPVTITATATDGAIVKSASQQITVTQPTIGWIDATYRSTSFPTGFQAEVFFTARTQQGGTVIPATFTVQPQHPSIATYTEIANTGWGLITGVGASPDTTLSDGSVVKKRAAFVVTATPVAGGTPYPFTSRSVTIEEPKSAGAIYAVNDEFGDPSPASAGSTTDQLITRPQYTLSYNQSRGTPNWVSYELDSRQIVSGGDRCNCFTGDPSLPADRRILASDYTNGGYDRGHMARSFDRTAANLDNASTFYMTNIVPQQGDLNQGVWASFENALGDSASAGGRAVYIVTGPLYTAGRTPATLNNAGKVAIPDSTWKVAVIGPRLGTDHVPFARANVQSWADLAGLTVLAVNMPNVAGIRSDAWSKYLTTVDKIEASTGLDILSLLPAAFQAAVEAGDHAPVASFAAPATGVEGAALAFDAAGSSDPDAGDALTFGWSWGDGSAAGTGVAPTHAFADNGTYTVTLTVTDKFGWQRATTRAVAVTNAAPVPTMSPTTTTVHVGEAFNPQARFTDAGAKDATWKAVVAWGDGTSLSTSLLAIPTTAIRASKAYAAPGQYTVRFTVTDKDGGSAFVETVVTVIP